MQDRPFLRRLNQIADWIIRIVVINVFMVLCTIFIVTFYAGYKVAYKMISAYIDDRHPPLFKGIWENLKKDFWHNVGIGGIFALFLAIGAYGAWQYNLLLAADPSIFNTFGFFITLGVTLLLIMSTIYTVTVAEVYNDLSIKNLYKIALALAGKFFLRSIAVLILTVLPWFIIIEPRLAPIFVLAGLSVPLIINVLLMRKPIMFLKGET